MGRTACAESECLYKGDLYLTWVKLHIHYINTTVLVIYLFCLFKEAAAICTS